MKKILLLLILLLIIPSVFALQEIDLDSFLNNPSISEAQKMELIKEALILQLPQIKEDFNSNSSIPKPIDFLLNNKMININSDLISLKLMFKDGKIETLDEGSFSDSDFNIYMTDQFLLDLIQNKIDFKQSLKKGDITFEGRGFFNKLKLTPIKLLIKLI